jgi:hypothetical protein
MKIVKGPALPVPGGANQRLSSPGVTTPFYNVSEFKPFLDQRKEPEASENRTFCGVCMKPRRMLCDDDLSDIIAISDFCRCTRAARRGHA